MAPEYAMGGRFSEKSDVFSFGVLVLEIISGRRNTSFYNDEIALSLLEYVKKPTHFLLTNFPVALNFSLTEASVIWFCQAWKIWNGGDFEALIDERISSPRLRGEIIRCIQIGFLCVQEYPGNRPSISTVLAMLGNEIVELPLPEQPALTQRPNRNRQLSSSSSSSQQTVSTGTVIITVIEGR